MLWVWADDDIITQKWLASDLLPRPSHPVCCRACPSGFSHSRTSAHDRKCGNDFLQLWVFSVGNSPLDMKTISCEDLWFQVLYSDSSGGTRVTFLYFCFNFWLFWDDVRRWRSRRRSSPHYNINRSRISHDCSHTARGGGVNQLGGVVYSPYSVCRHGNRHVIQSFSLLIIIV